MGGQELVELAFGFGRGGARNLDDAAGPLELLGRDFSLPLNARRICFPRRRGPTGRRRDEHCPGGQQGANGAARR